MRLCDLSIGSYMQIVTQRDTCIVGPVLRVDYKDGDFGLVPAETIYEPEKTLPISHINVIQCMYQGYYDHAHLNIAIVRGDDLYDQIKFGRVKIDDFNFHALEKVEK